MSQCLCTVGRHNLKTDSLESVAGQLSDIFDINVKWEEWRTNHFVELGRIVKHEGQPFYALEDDSDTTDPVFFYLVCHEDEEANRKNLFFYMEIHQEVIEVDFYGWPYSASQFMCCFWKWDYLMDAEMKGLMLEFRLKCKEVFGKLGSSRCISFADDTGRLDDSDMNLPWDEYERRVLSREYLEDVEASWREDSMVVNVPDFLSGRNPTRCEGAADVFIDDFSDLKCSPNQPSS